MSAESSSAQGENSSCITPINPEMLRIIIMQMHLFPSRAFLRFAGCTTDTFLYPRVLSGFGSKVVTKHFNFSVVDDLFCLKVIFLLHQCLLSARSLSGILPLLVFFFPCNEEDGMVTDKTLYDFSRT